MKWLKKLFELIFKKKEAEDENLVKYMEIIYADYSKIECYKENHHVFPAHMCGGRDTKCFKRFDRSSCRVLIPYDKHVLAHYYLWKYLGESGDAAFLKQAINNNKLKLSGLSEEEIKAIAIKITPAREQGIADQVKKGHKIVLRWVHRDGRVCIKSTYEMKKMLESQGYKMSDIRVFDRTLLGEERSSYGFTKRNWACKWELDVEYNNEELMDHRKKMGY